MDEPGKASRLRRLAFDRPVLKLSGVLVFIVVAYTLVRLLPIPLLKYLFALATIAAVLYAVVLVGHIVNMYLIRKALARLLSAGDIMSLLVSYAMFIAGVLLVISVLFMVVEELHLGYLTHGPTTDAFNSEAIDSEDPDIKDPNISHEYLYFATITFFTVGYGDICPMGLCRTLAMITAFAGNVVTVVLMAIVVTLYVNRTRGRPDQPQAP